MINYIIIYINLLISSFYLILFILKSRLNQGLNNPLMIQFTLPTINYSYKDLEPHIDTETMELHHTKHHVGYITNLNNEIASTGIFENTSLQEILRQGSSSKKINDNAGGHYNHSMFWMMMSQNSRKDDIGKHLNENITHSFGSFDNMVETFNNEAVKVFGSGWVWLMMKKDGSLTIESTPNQDSPIMNEDVVPFLGLDVWEHAYYLKYRNLRKNYIMEWWNVVNWKNVDSLYEKYARNGNVVEVKYDGTIDI